VPASTTTKQTAPRRPGGAIHQGLVSLLRDAPSWLVDVLEQLGELPRGRTIEQLPTEVWPPDEEQRRRELRADLVMRLWQGNKPDDVTLAKIRKGGVIGLLVEVQCTIDELRGERWGEFGSAYRPRLGPHFLLVILSIDAKVVAWIHEVVAALDSRIRVVLLAPGLIPKTDGLDTCEVPHRVLLEAMFHAEQVSAHDPSLLVAALRALAEFEGDEHVIYRQMLLSQFGKEQVMAALKSLEASQPPVIDDEYVLSDTELRSFLYVSGQERGLEQGREEGLEQGREEGLEQGRAQALLDVLDARGLSPNTSQRARILACHDLERLRAWLVAALTCESVERLLDAEREAAAGAS
jgi:hypothetical protein